MIYWVKTPPQADIDYNEYRPFIRNDWFRKHYMFFAYGLMALLTVLFFVPGFSGFRFLCWFSWCMNCCTSW